jgi:hypothetical protein
VPFRFDGVLKVILFFTPAAAPALVMNDLEGVQAKGMPDMGDLVRSLQDLGGRTWTIFIPKRSKPKAPNCAKRQDSDDIRVMRDRNSAASNGTGM